MERRRYLALAGAAATGGCLRLQNEGPATETESGQSGTASTGDGTDPTAGGETPAETTDTLGEITGTWSQYGYDAANSGWATDESGPTGEVTEQWRVTDGTLAPLSSTPAVADGRVYFVNNVPENPSEVWAVDASTSETIWQQTVGGVWDGSPAVVGGQVFLGTNRGAVVALDAETGGYNWQTSLETTVTSYNRPTVTDDVLHITDENGRLYALDPSDGSEIGRIELDGWCVSGPAHAGEQVFVTTYGPTDESAYPDDMDGYNFFSGYNESEPTSSLVDMDGSGTVHAVSGGDASLDWQVDLPDFVVATPTVVDGTVYVGCWDGYLYALDAADGSQQWRYDLGTPVSGSASVANGTVYVGGLDAVVHAIDADGNQEWILPPAVGNGITTKPAVADGVVYVNVIDDGIVAVGTGGTREWKFEGPVGDFDQSSPVVADGALFVCGVTERRSVDGDQEDVGGLFMIA